MPTLAAMLRGPCATIGALPKFSLEPTMRFSHIMKRLLLITSAALLALLLAYLFWTAKQIERESTLDDAQAADVIIVLGAAEYRGKPFHH